MTDKLKLHPKGGVLQADVIVTQEGKYYIAFIPALNLASHSTTKKKALIQLDSAIKLFFDYWVSKNKLHEKLISLGWEQYDDHLKPSQDNIQIPLSLLNKSHSFKNLPLPAYC